MKYMKLDDEGRESLLIDLEEMPRFLEESFSQLPDDKITKRSEDGYFSPIEHVWHLADLEQQGFSFRLQRLLKTKNPELPDFPGGEIAKQRNYRELSLAEGLKAFSKARKNNVTMIKAIKTKQWNNQGKLRVWVKLRFVICHIC